MRINAHWPARKQKQSTWCRRPFRPELPLRRSHPRSSRSLSRRSALAEHNVTDLATLGSKVAAVALVPGEQLLSTRMVEEKSFLGPSRIQVPAGLQELTLKLPIERVAGGKVTAGDTVGVFLSLEQATDTGADGQPGAKSSKTQLSFHKVLVTAAQFSNGTAAQTGNPAPRREPARSPPRPAPPRHRPTKRTSSPSPGTRPTAERIVFAAEFGKVYLSKEPGDAVEEGASYVDSSRLFR